MQADRAIFTSASSLMAQGYRIVAASAGLTSVEKREITKHSPSHEALCDKSENASGTSFYRLSTGRVCVSYTCHSGNEESGRGGKRVLTNVLILDPTDFEHAGANPFAILRSAGERLDFQAIPPKNTQTLDTIMLNANAGDPSLGLEPKFPESYEAVDDSSRTFLIDRAISEGCMIAVLDSGGCDVVEGTFLSIPVTMRVQCDFSIGLRFALARKYRLNFVSGDTGPMERVIKGQRIIFLKSWEDESVTQHEKSPWTQMVSDCRTRNLVQTVLNLTDQRFDDESLSAMDSIAQRQMNLNRLDDGSLESWFETLAENHDALCPIERRMAENQQKRAAECISRTLERTDTDELSQWMDLLVFQSPRYKCLEESLAALQARIAEQEAPLAG